MAARAGGEVDVATNLRPKYSRFTQQELPACRPLMTPLVVTWAFFGLGFLFLPLGVVAFRASRSVVDQVRLAAHRSCPVALSSFPPRGWVAGNRTACQSRHAPCWESCQPP
jgi:hypothetical protein